ncbi:MAG: helix-turn-helix transcriptional regulator [Actinomycetota bacterium]
MEVDLREFGERVKLEREKRNNMNHKVLAEFAGITPPYVYKIESGAIRPSVPVIRAIADALALIENNVPYNARRYMLRIELLKLAGYEIDAIRDQLFAAKQQDSDEQSDRLRIFCDNFARLMKADPSAAANIEGLLDRLAPPSELAIQSK